MEIFLGFMFICFVVGVILIVCGESKGVKEGMHVQQGSVRTHPDNKRKSDISEPVISIVESFKEKGRWKIEPCFDLFKLRVYRDLVKFKVTDTFTGEVYNLISHQCYYHYTRYKQITVPNRLHSSSAPSWMTPEEWDYLSSVVQGHMDNINQRLEVIKDRQRTKDEKQAKVNQDKERQRLKELYCK